MRRCFSDVRASAVSRARHKARRPASSGSATDNGARILAQELSKELGQSIIIENRPGGAFVIGNDAVAKAQPDGYTLLFGSIGAFAIGPHMVAKLPYDVERDFQPIAQVTTGHLLLAVAPSLPIHSVAELIEHAKKNPGKLSNASSGSGSPGHVSGELFKFMSGTEIVHVPYKGGTAAITDIIAGRVDLMFESLTSIAPHARQKAIRALGVAVRSVRPASPTCPRSLRPAFPVMKRRYGSASCRQPARLARSSISSTPPSTAQSSLTSSKHAMSKSATSRPAGRPRSSRPSSSRKSAKWADVVKRSGAKLE